MCLFYLGKICLFYLGKGEMLFIIYSAFFTWGKEIFYLGRRDERVFGAVVSVSL